MLPFPADGFPGDGACVSSHAGVLWLSGVPLGAGLEPGFSELTLSAGSHGSHPRRDIVAHLFWECARWRLWNVREGLVAPPTLQPSSSSGPSLCILLGPSWRSWNLEEIQMLELIPQASPSQKITQSAPGG